MAKFTSISNALLSLGLILCLANLNFVMWQTGLVFAEINEQSQSSSEDEVPADFSLETLNQECILALEIFSFFNNQNVQAQEQLMGHFEIDSPPPKELA